jgi:hypothetical protein
MMHDCFCVRGVIVRCGSARAVTVAIDTAGGTAQARHGENRCALRGLVTSALEGVGIATPSANAVIASAGVAVCGQKM